MKKIKQDLISISMYKRITLYELWYVIDVKTYFRNFKLEIRLKRSIWLLMFIILAYNLFVVAWFSIFIIFVILNFQLSMF